MKNKITSRNGHVWKRVKNKPFDYFMVDDDRFENYFESVHEFSKRANPKRYAHQERVIKGGASN